MKDRYRLTRRGNRYYAVDRNNQTRETLGTDDLKVARRLLVAKNEAAQQTNLNLLIGRTYLGANDPMMVQRTWQVVMSDFCRRGKAQTWARRERAMRSPALAPLKTKKLVETTAEDLRQTMDSGGASVNHFLRCLHNLALGMGWIPSAIIPPKLWPQPQQKEQRAITQEEHGLIMASEKNPERRDFYQLLWEIGSSQSDAAALTTENIDWENRVLTYQRQKTGEWASIQIGKRLEDLLKKLPRQGFLFPRISQTTAGERSGDFWRRCKVAKVFGVSLHSYRYAWAQRARANGYPIRWAQNALGHNSRAVHLSYARGVVAVCPSLEDYEHNQKINRSSDCAKECLPNPTEGLNHAAAAGNL
jgi:integrase